MRDIWKETEAWTAAGRPCALARVIDTWGSSPRQPGAAMIVDAEGRVAGSVSGGCIEGAVVEEARKVLAGAPPQTLEFGVADETAWSVGLSCGGEVQVRVERHPATAGAAQWAALRQAVNEDTPTILLTRLDSQAPAHLLVYADGTAQGDWGALQPAAVQQALAIYAERESRLFDLDGIPVFCHLFRRRDHLIIVGAGHIAVPLVHLAHTLDFETVVLDPRRIFAVEERFATPPDRLVAAWPHTVLADWDLNDDTYAVLLTHDPKIDDPALHLFLRAPLRYIGALGSRKTHAKRRDRLAAAGFTPAQIDRIHGPVGLDIGAQSPAEIALSVLAQLVAARQGRL